MAQENIYVDIRQSLHAIPIFEGDCEHFYGFLNAAQQFIETHGNNPRIIEQVLSRLKGKPAHAICIVTHTYNWVTIKAALIELCGGGKTIDLYKHEILNMNLGHGSFEEMVFKLDSKLFAMESMLIGPYYSKWNQPTEVLFRENETFV